LKHVLVAAAALLLAGCVERRLLVASEPTGARIWVNGVDQGTTPASIPYVHPGRFDVRLEKAGYRSLATEVVTPTTFDAVPGPDFFAENGPWRIYRESAVTIPMEPLQSRRLTREEQKALIQRAEAFRAQSAAAAAEAGTPPPTRPHEGASPAAPPPPATSPAGR